MSKDKSYESDPEGVLTTLFFTAPNKPPGYGHGFVVRFAVPPKVGDILNVDQYSIKQVPQEELHVCTWRIVDVQHDISLHTEDEKEVPASGLRVTVHPQQ